MYTVQLWSKTLRWQCILLCKSVVFLAVKCWSLVLSLPRSVSLFDLLKASFCMDNVRSFLFWTMEFTYGGSSWPLITG